MLEPMLRYEGPTLAHSEADVWLALILWRDRVGPTVADPQIHHAHAGLSLVLEVMGNHAYTAWVEPVYLALDHYIQAPATAAADDLLRAAELHHPGVPATDPRPARAYRPFFVEWAPTVTPSELAALRSLTWFVSDVARATAQPILLALMRFMLDGLAVLASAGPSERPVDPPVADEA